MSTMILSSSELRRRVKLRSARRDDRLVRRRDGCMGLTREIGLVVSVIGRLFESPLDGSKRGSHSRVTNPRAPQKGSIPCVPSKSRDRLRRPIRRRRQSLFRRAANDNLCKSVNRLSSRMYSEMRTVSAASISEFAAASWKSMPVQKRPGAPSITTCDILASVPRGRGQHQVRESTLN